ncbi:CotY/CotZ family spore coat protein [Paenisporosarcina cavernae]|uniref:Spore coat protein CotZ n=1 Tax=Paenisporosarcina cavernae TaxID=2320858 RepID=A0A385YRB6_9BACL|nr:CotY/CotZ family spore coat protein [Paenisporosarcina cavernae]AYC29031.1 spore coat protein CotZ [Paenisporosarcina cavernae]
MGCGRFEESTSTGVLGTTSGRCVCDVLRFIKDIQDQVTDNDCPACPTNCFLEPLGGLVSPVSTQFDTRVFMLITKDGTPFKAFFRDRDRCDHDCFSVFFRVEDIFDGCCATLRVLEPLDKHGHEVNLLTECGTALKLSKICEVRDFRSSSSCITVDLNCFCGIECIKDTYLGVCD